jgi:hypothetical protein
MPRGKSVPCPVCGAPLEVALEVVVGARLTLRSKRRYGIGAIQQTAAELRHRLECQYAAADGSLFLDDDGYVVQCSRRPRCIYIATLVPEGLETDEDRRRDHAERTAELREKGVDL